MPPTSLPASLGDLLISITSEMVEQQKRLDSDYLERLEAFKLVCEEVGMVMNGTEIEMQLRFARSVEETLSLRVQPVDASFMRRYAYSEFTQNSLQLKLERIPLDHAAQRKPKS